MCPTASLLLGRFPNPDSWLAKPRNDLTPVMTLGTWDFLNLLSSHNFTKYPMCLFCIIYVHQSTITPGSQSWPHGSSRVPRVRKIKNITGWPGLTLARSDRQGGIRPSKRPENNKCTYGLRRNAVLLLLIVRSTKRIHTYIFFFLFFIPPCIFLALLSP